MTLGSSPPASSPHHCALRRRLAEPRHRFDPLRPAGRPLAHWFRGVHHRLLPQEACATRPQRGHVGSPRRDRAYGCCSVLVRDKRCWRHRGCPPAVDRVRGLLLSHGVSRVEGLACEEYM